MEAHVKQRYSIVIGMLSLLWLGLVLPGSGSSAAEIKVLSSANMTPLFNSITGEFEPYIRA
jgi:hypothetical protein